ncbi:hypothetical protein JI435_163150, partial [Parastagonospora nodorum SN15]
QLLRRSHALQVAELGMEASFYRPAFPAEALLHFSIAQARSPEHGYSQRQSQRQSSSSGHEKPQQRHFPERGRLSPSQSVPSRVGHAYLADLYRPHYVSRVIRSAASPRTLRRWPLTDGAPSLSTSPERVGTGSATSPVGSTVD